MTEAQTTHLLILVCVRACVCNPCIYVCVDVRIKTFTVNIFACSGTYQIKLLLFLLAKDYIHTITKHMGARKVLVS